MQKLNHANLLSAVHNDSDYLWSRGHYLLTIVPSALETRLSWKTGMSRFLAIQVLSSYPAEAQIKQQNDNMLQNWIFSPYIDGT